MARTSKGLTLRIGRQTFPAKNLAEASAKYREVATAWERAHPQGQRGSYAFPKTGEVESGAHRYHISYNGKVWVDANSWEKITRATELLYDPSDPFQNDFRAAHESMLAMRSGAVDPMSFVVEAPKGVRAVVR